MVSPPLTRSPTATFTAVPIGRNVSIRDPNRIKPNRSPHTARSPGETQQTIRLAINPATCTHSTFAPCTVRIIKAFCSFLNVASGLLATRNKPGWYCTSSIAPSQGIRLMCTSNTFKKIVSRILRSLMNRGSNSSSMAMTFPSPGATTRRGPCGTTREGLRKNQETKQVRIAAPTATIVQSSHPASSVTPTPAPMKGIPSLANGIPTARSATKSPRVTQERCSSRLFSRAIASKLPRHTRWCTLRIRTTLEIGFNILLVFILINQLVLLQPGHHRPQPAPDFFDGMGFTFSEQRIVDRAVCLILQHPLLGELTLLNFPQDLFHFLL